MPFPCLAKEARHGAPGPPQGLKPAFILTLDAALLFHGCARGWDDSRDRVQRQDQSQKQRQGQRTGVSVPHGQRQGQHRRQGQRCGRSWFPPFRKRRERWGIPV
jgi:hypothetical protein